MNVGADEHPTVRIPSINNIYMRVLDIDAARDSELINDFIVLLF
jgi:hypothetical protein